jgi:GNAT superfamily N-acetyltransferase
LDIVYRAPRSEEAEACAHLAGRAFAVAHVEQLHPDDLTRGSDFVHYQRLWSLLSNGMPKKAKTFVNVAFDGNIPIGYILSRRNIFDEQPWERGHLSALYVAPEYYRNGIGRQLLLNAFQHCEHNISNHMGVRVLQSDERARMFYERFGAKYVSSGFAREKHVQQPRIDYLAFNKLDKIMVEKFGHVMPLESHLKRLMRRIVQHF